MPFKKKPKPAHKSEPKSKVRFRSKVKIPVQYWRIDEKKQPAKERGHIALAKDLSHEGMYIKTGKRLEKGEILRLEIYIRHKTKHIYALAEVVWADKKGGGLHLMLMPEEDKESLKKYLEKVELPPPFDPNWHKAK
jgi:hypothetical protein